MGLSRASSYASGPSVALTHHPCTWVTGTRVTGHLHVLVLVHPYTVHTLPLAHQAVLVANEAANERLLRRLGDNCMLVLTVHECKGLEFQVRPHHANSLSDCNTPCPGALLAPIANNLRLPL